MRHVRSVLQFILDRHDPYGAVVLDCYSNLVMANAAATRLLGGLIDPTLLIGTPNMMRMVFHPLGLRSSIVNWDEVARHLMSRAERELGELRDDSVGTELLAELRGYAGASRRHAPAVIGPADILLPVHIRKGDLDVRLFSTIMTLGTPQDVTLQELRIETFFPADEASAAAIRQYPSS